MKKSINKCQVSRLKPWVRATLQELEKSINQSIKPFKLLEMQWTHNLRVFLIPSKPKIDQQCQIISDRLLLINSGSFPSFIVLWKY